MKVLIIFLCSICTPFVFAQDCGDTDYGCQIAANKKSNDIDSIFRLAYAYGEIGQHQDAIREYTRYIDLDPQNPAIFSNRGLEYAQIKKYRLAVQDFTRAIELDPTDAEYYHNRTESRIQLGDRAGSVEDFNVAIALDPSNAAIFFNRGLNYDEMGVTSLAIADYSKALELAKTCRRSS